MAGYKQGMKLRTVKPVWNEIGLALQAEDPTFAPREYPAGQVCEVDYLDGYGLVAFFEDGSWMTLEADMFEVVE